METQESINYRRVERAIQYITDHFKEQPTLDDVAKHVHMSPTHFQRLFAEWAGTTPKKFLKFISLQHAKQLIVQHSTISLFDTTHEIGLSSTSRLHDMFVSIEGMTPAEYKNGGKNLLISYEFYDSPFGEALIASTDRGVCHMTFHTLRETAEDELKMRFPNATFRQIPTTLHQDALAVFKRHENNLPRIKLHLKGTDFQLKVWEALLKIPSGSLSTYGAIAKHIDNQLAHRAVGTAIGSNPVAFLIPCHRVIQGSGSIGGYRWGNARKTALIGWEQAQLESKITD